MLFEISPRRVAGGLMLMVFVLTLASLGQHTLEYFWGRAGWGYEGLLAIPQTFNLGEDANVPTWYSSFMLLVCSILLAVIAAAKKRRRDRYTLHWAVLSGIFLLMSVDEVATVHEAVGDALGSVFKSLGFTVAGLLYANWVIPGTIFVCVVLFAYLRFLVALPKETRRWFLVAGALFVAGAIGAEMLSSRLVSLYGSWEHLENLPDNIKLVIVMQTTIEELLEMSGVVVFVYALLSYASSYVNEITVRIQAPNK